MIPVNLQAVPVEIETLGPWRLDGQVVETGTVVSVLPSLAADLIARGKARRYVAPAPVVEPDAEPAPQPDPEPVVEPDAEPAPQPDPEPVVEPDAEPAPQPDAEPAPQPDPETPPAPTPVARGKK